MTLSSNERHRASVKTSRIGVVLFSLGYVIALTWSYIQVIAPVFVHYQYRPPALWAIVASWGVALMPGLWLPLAFHRPSNFLTWFLYLVVFVPSCVIPLYAGSSHWLGLGLTLVGAFWILTVASRLPILRMPRLKLTTTQFWFLMVVLSVLAYTAVIATFGLRFHFPLLSEVYELRFEYSERAPGAGSLVTSLLSWQGYVLNPLLMSWGFLSRAPLLIVVAFAGQLVLFSINGFKTFLLGGLLVGAVWLVMRSEPQRFGLRMVTGALSLVVGSTLLDLLLPLPSPVVTSLFVRRFIVTPGLLTGHYFDFFSANPKTMFGQYSWATFEGYPYDLPPPFLIGQAYFGSVQTAANANPFADGFATLGIPGVYVMALLLGVVFWLIDSVSRRRDPRLVVLFLTMPALALSNSSLLTVLLTHGLGLAIVLLSLLPASLGRIGDRLWLRKGVDGAWRAPK